MSEQETTSVEKEVKPKKTTTKKKTSSTKKKTTKKSSSTKKKSVKKEPKVEEIVKEEKIEPKETSKPKSDKLQFTSKSSTKHESNSKGILIALAFAIVVVIIAGGWYQTQQLNKSNQDATVNLDQKIETEVSSLKEKLQNLTAELQEQAEKENESDIELIEYTSPESNLTFKYPASLGAIEVDMVENDETSTADNIMRLTFTANPDIWINFTGPEYVGEESFTYNGTTENIPELCPTPLDITEQGFCDTKIIANQDTIETISPIGDESILNIVKSTNLNLAGPQFTGVSFNVGLGVPPVTGRSLFAPTDDDKQNEALLDFYRSILKKERLSLVVKENLEIYQEILNTITIGQ